MDWLKVNQISDAILLEDFLHQYTRNKDPSALAQIISTAKSGKAFSKDRELYDRSIELSELLTGF